MQHISQSIKPRFFGTDRLPQGKLLQYTAKYSCTSGLETFKNAVFLPAKKFNLTKRSIVFQLKLQLKQFTAELFPLLEPLGGPQFTDETTLQICLSHFHGCWICEHTHIKPTLFTPHTGDIFFQKTLQFYPTVLMSFPAGVTGQFIFVLQNWWRLNIVTSEHLLANRSFYFPVFDNP